MHREGLDCDAYNEWARSEAAVTGLGEVDTWDLRGEAAERFRRAVGAADAP